MARRILPMLAALVISATCAVAERVLPVDEAPRDAEFAAFRARLLAAVVARDVDAILSMTSDDVQLSFGMDSGHERFVEMMTVPEETLSGEYRFEAPAMREAYWAALESTLRLGGAFASGGDQFVAPYLFTLELPDVADPFAVYWITAEDVPLYDRPIRWSEEVGRLSWDVVTAIEGGEGADYVHVRTQDGRTGFVHQEYARALVDYRAFFDRRGGRWLLTTFIAGD